MANTLFLWGYAVTQLVHTLGMTQLVHTLGVTQLIHTLGYKVTVGSSVFSLM